MSTITILSGENSWMNQYIPGLIQELSQIKDNTISWIHRREELNEGDLAFILSYERILSKEHLAFHKNNIVVHASDLPKGKGMSPMTWQVLEGKNEIPLSLFEAVEQLDAGDIYMKDRIVFEGHELVDEMQHALGETIVRMCVQFAKVYPEIVKTGQPQSGKSTVYKKRSPKDSCLDVDKSLREQFNLLRVVDNDKYPAFFEMAGHRYVLRIEKCDRIEE